MRYSFWEWLAANANETIGQKLNYCIKYSASRLHKIQARANNRLPLRYPQSQTVFNSTENCYIPEYQQFSRNI